MLHHFGFYLLRHPVKSLDSLLQFHQQLSFLPFENVLRSWYQKSTLAQEAIFVASPTLYQRFLQWLADEPISEKEQLQLTLYKYFIRMSTRATPYGLFAGCATGRISEKTSIQRAPEDVSYKHTRLDIEWLIALKEWLVEQPDIRAQLKLFPNSSIYTIGDHFRYVEQNREQQQRNYFISSIESNEYIKLIFAATKNGVTLPELTAILVNEGIDYTESHDFIVELIDNKILTFDIEPTITGINYLDLLITKLSALKDIQPLILHLETLRLLLNQEENRIAMYEKVQKGIQSLGIPVVKKDIVQVDTFFKYSENQIGEHLIQNIQRQISKLFVLNEQKTNADMEEFKRRFKNRYEDEEVSFTLALDHEIGIGYGSISSLGSSYTPMIDDLSFSSTHLTEKAPSATWWQNFVLGKYTEALQNNSKEVKLSNADLAYIASQRFGQDQKNKSTQADRRSLPSSFYIFGNLLATSLENADKGEFNFNLLACSGPSAINILSRFHEGDKELHGCLQQCISQEEQHNPDIIFAEIVHCPDSRAGNIMTRPTLYQHEIPYMGKASVPDNFQIPIQDLMISLRSGQIVLRSKRLNKRIVPRLSNAHNYQTGLPIYRFLCDLQHQDTHLNVNWNWSLLEQQAYLPRVCYQNIIVRRASWILQNENFKDLNLSLFPSKLKEMGLPTQFVIASGDNELMIDTRISYSLELLFQNIRKKGTIRVLEFLSTPENCLLKHNGLSYTSELVIPFLNSDSTPIPGLSAIPLQIPQRKFSIGSQWLYLKVYTGERSSDTILVQHLFPIIKKLLDDHIINKFFFVRYKDPDSHLRLRFLGNHRLEFYHHVIRAIEDVLHKNIQTGIVYKVQVDTYHRELERYGMECIDTCESIFHCDSMDTLKFLFSTGEACNENMRFTFAMSQINNLLANAELSSYDRFDLMDKLKESFFNEFNGDSTLRKQLSNKYRDFRPLMGQALKECYSVPMSPSIVKLINNSPDKHYLTSILSSLIHMTINRIFPSKQRAYELIIYHCMAKYYNSVSAMQQVEA